jgi:hypothetical protein
LRNSSLAHPESGVGCRSDVRRAFAEVDQVVRFVLLWKLHTVGGESLGSLYENLDREYPITLKPGVA